MSAFAQQPDVIFTNARIYVGATDTLKGGPSPVERAGAPAGICDKPEPAMIKNCVLAPIAQAVAIKDGKVQSIGLADAVKKLAGPKTQVIDLKGAFVMPGFNDAHAHLANGGFEKLNVNLIGTKSLAEMQSRIAVRVKDSKPGEWIVGRGWDHTKWDVKETPTRADIDKVTGDHPAIFTRVDGHIAIANSAALKAAGVTKDTKDPQGGKIDRDANGEPTGIMRETSMSLIWEKVPDPTKEQRRKAIELALADAAKSGVTSAQDNSGWEDFLIYEEMEKKGKLTLRISEWLPFDAPVEQLEKMRAHHDAKDPMLHTGMLKGFMDGSLGSGTAALLAPYADNHSTSGIPRYTQDQLDKLAIERSQHFFQIGFHAIGDRGAEMALTAFSIARKEMPATQHEAMDEHCPIENLGPGCYGPHVKTDLRPRIEHDQVIAPDQFKKYKDLGVIASVQPNHLLTDMNWAEQRIGAERAKTSYPWKQFLDNGVPLAFGTDYPVEPITPFRGVYAAVTRMNEEGTKSYYPEQKLTIDQAIAAYTTGSAYAEFAEKEKGTLAPGMLADFVVLDRDITKVPPAEILKTQVLRTVVGGKTVYQVPGT
jgi:predicted amidohydrolase YtcJ